jgi:uncharacterized membrane protein
MTLGLLMVFVLPGFALACAAVPRYQSPVERLLATVGLSLAITTCTAVLLAALPVGLSRESLAVVLGGLTIALSIGAAFRTGSNTRGDRSPRARRNASTSGTSPSP